ncbi:MAG: RsmB/NOP family class I SAM-dependent RNA methyltransferase [Candidatus Gracilibacteria bacterium]|jgi:NOL1/NOP2/sun family putative RNA methylase
MKQTFQDYFRSLIGEAEAEQFFCSIKDRQTRRSVRVNTLKTTKKELTIWLTSQCYSVKNNPFCTEGIDLEGRGEELSLKLPYHSGFTYPQDSASMFGICVLSPRPGETVLDLTAAPGGKTTFIAQKMKNTGVLIANDMDTKRLKSLHYNLERLGIWNAAVLRTQPHKIAEYYPNTFDKILLDPSCSGEGLLVTPDGKPDFWSEKSLKRYAAEQYGLLLSAFRMLKPGGRLVFSTCTLNNIEDEGVVERLIEKMPDAYIEDTAPASAPEQIGALKGIRFWPHKTHTKGFFCIAIGKKSATEEAEEIENSSENKPANRHQKFKKSLPEKQNIKTLTEKQLEPFKNFISGYFGCELPPKAAFTIRDETLFMLSQELADFPLLPFYSLSFPLLKIYPDELRPTHAGALLLGIHATRHVYALSREEVLKAFLRQPIQNTSGEKGLYIAKYEDFPIGIAKLTDRGIEIVFPHQF